MAPRRSPHEIALLNIAREMSHRGFTDEDIRDHLVDCVQTAMLDVAAECKESERRAAESLEFQARWTKCVGCERPMRWTPTHAEDVPECSAGCVKAHAGQPSHAEVSAMVAS